MMTPACTIPWRMAPFAACILVSSTMAGESTLATLVGADAALFIEARQVDRQLSQLAESELIRRWHQSSLSGWLQPNAPDPVSKWQSADAYVAATTGVSLRELLRGLFGDAVALALYLSATTKDPQGVLLARASSSAAIDRVLISWARVEPPLRIEQRSSAHGPYTRRIFKRDGSERSLYYAHRDRIFVLSDQERLVQDCLARAAAPSEQTQTLATSTEFIELTQHFGERPWLIACLNPRRWDRILADEAANSDQHQRLFHAWQSLRNVGGAISIDDGVEAELLVRLDEGRTSSGWRTFAAPAGSPSILQFASNRTVAAFGARVRWPWLIDQWQQLLAPHDRDGLVKARRVLNGLLANLDLLNDVAPLVLDDWGMLVEPRTESAALPWWAQWNLLGAAFFPQHLPNSVRMGLDNALLFGSNALAADRNGRDDHSLWYAERNEAEGTLQCILKGPPHMSPGYSLSSSRLLLASQSELLKRPPVVAPQPSRLITLAARRFSEARLYAWLDLKALQAASSGVPVYALTVLSQLADQAHVAAGWTERELWVRAGLSIDRQQ